MTLPKACNRGADPSVASRPRQSLLWPAIAIVVLTWIVFFPALFYPFHFDDRLFLHDDNIQLGRWEEFVQPPVKRVLSWLTFWLQYQAHGPDPRFFHAFNLAVHALNAVLVFLLLRILVGERRPATAAASFLGALVFALHPLQSEAAIYVYQRSTLLATGAGFLALLAYLRGKHILSLLAFLVALGFKEFAVVLPGVFYCADLFLRNRPRPSRTALAASALALAAGLIFAGMADKRTLGRWEEAALYAATQVKALWLYLGLAVLPLKQNIDWHLEPQENWGDPVWMAALLGLPALAVSLVLWRRRSPQAAFCGAVFLLFLLPTSSLVPSQDFFFEHRVYASLLGWAGLVALGVGGLSRKALSCRGAAAALLLTALLPAGYAWASVERSRVWQSEESLWRDAVRKSPRKYRPHYNLGVLVMESSPAEVLSPLSRAVEIDPSLPLAYRALGQAYFQLGLPEQALENWSRALGLDPYDAQSHLAAGQIHLLQRDYPTALQHLQQARELQPSEWRTYYHLGRLYLELGLSSEAIELSQEGLRLDWRNARLRFLLADAVFQTGNWKRAIELYREGLEQEQDARAWFSLTQAYRASGQQQEAREAARQGIAAARSPEERRFGEQLLESLN